MQKAQSRKPATSATAASWGAPARVSAAAADSETGAMNSAQASGKLCATIDSVTIISTAIVHIRSEEHTSELQSLMRISYAVFCLKKKKTKKIDAKDTSRALLQKTKELNLLKVQVVITNN